MFVCCPLGFYLYQSAWLASRRFESMMAYSTLGVYISPCIPAQVFSITRDWCASGKKEITAPRAASPKMERGQSSFVYG